MGIGAIGAAAPNVTPQKTGGGQNDVAQLERKLDALNKQLKEVKENDKLDPEKKKKKIEDIEKQIAETERKIAQMKQKEKAGGEKQNEEVREQEEAKANALDNYLIDEYA